MGSQSSHLYHATYSVFCTEIFENVFSPHRPPLNKWSVLILYMKFFYMYATYTKHFKYSKQEMCSKHWLNGKMKISVTRKVFFQALKIWSMLHWNYNSIYEKWSFNQKHFGIRLGLFSIFSLLFFLTILFSFFPKYLWKVIVKYNPCEFNILKGTYWDPF